MKNQYFADKRDFLKYDLLLELFEAPPEINLLTYFGFDVFQGSFILSPTIRGALADSVDSHRLPLPLEGVV